MYFAPDKIELNDVRSYRMQLRILVERFACHETEIALDLVNFPRVLIRSRSSPPATSSNERRYSVHDSNNLTWGTCEGGILEKGRAVRTIFRDQHPRDPPFAPHHSIVSRDLFGNRFERYTLDDSRVFAILRTCGSNRRTRVLANVVGGG